MAAVATVSRLIVQLVTTPLSVTHWKRIGWHLGKSLRDILRGTPGDTGPSKEERLAQRRRDVLRGFTYLDHFQELEEWSPEDVDPIQIANTPLVRREIVEPQKSTGLRTSKVLLCHDYKGGYHDYESVRPAEVSTEDYSCEYLQYVDTFIYFSHKLVCVPPPTWTNLLHRNGVKVLGTLIVEPQSPDVERLLRECDGHLPAAKQLACMADTFGFDGWLLNIEKEFPRESEDCIGRLTHFIQALKQHLGSDKHVVWYDALTVANEVDYQNGLTPKNLPFARAADALFTNYEWMPTNVFEARRIATENGISTENVFFGIDVWAQNTRFSGPPRVTYPPEGGGGTNTGVLSKISYLYQRYIPWYRLIAVNALANLNFSTAIFAPGWTFEHFRAGTDRSGHAREAPQAGRLVEQTMWEGAKLSKDLQCDCLKGIQQHKLDFQNHPIVRHAREYPAGSATYFETDFNRAFTVGRRSEQALQDSFGILPQLGTQSILPHLLPLPRKLWDKLPEAPPTQVIYGEIANGLDGTGLNIYTKTVGQSKQDSTITTPFPESPVPGLETHRLCLYNLSMPTHSPLAAHITYRRLRVARSTTTGFYFAYHSHHTQPSLSYTYHPAPYPSSSSTHSDITTILIPITPLPHPDHRLIELGTYISSPRPSNSTPSPSPAPLHLLTIQHISILPAPVPGPATSKPAQPHITNLHIATRGAPPHTQKRLVWHFQSHDITAQHRLPYSKTTGPFSHFRVRVDGRLVGRAYACEFPLRREDFGHGEDEGEVVTHEEGEAEAEAEVNVAGVLFGGGEVLAQGIKVGARGVFGSRE